MSWKSGSRPSSSICGRWRAASACVSTRRRRAGRVRRPRRRAPRRSASSRQLVVAPRAGRSGTPRASCRARGAAALAERRLRSRARRRAGRRARATARRVDGARREHLVTAYAREAQRLGARRLALAARARPSASELARRRELARSAASTARPEHRLGRGARAPRHPRRASDSSSRAQRVAQLAARGTPRAAPSGRAPAADAARSTSTGDVADRRSRAASRCARRRRARSGSRLRLAPEILSMLARTPSRSPYSCSSCAAVLSPMPGTPGMLSEVSPFRP